MILYGTVQSSPGIGPFPSEDTTGMGIVVYILQRLLDKDRYRYNLKFETARKLRSTYSNIWHSSRQTLNTSVMARDINKTHVTSCLTFELCFERFILGMHKKMGDEVYQDHAITLAVIHKLIKGLDFDFSHSKLSEEKEAITNQAIFVLAVFFVALRGKKVFKLMLGKARDCMMEAKSNRTHPRLVLPLRGRFKEKIGKSFHFVVVTTRSNSGLEIGKWLERGITFHKRRGFVRGYFFTNSKGGMTRAKDLKVDILNRIARIQQSYPELIRSRLEVH